MLGDSPLSGKTTDPDAGAAFSPAEFAEKLAGLETQFASLRAQLKTLQRYAAVGTMTAVVAHEMNNLLTPLLSYSQYVLTKDDPALWRKALERNVRRGEQLARLCGNILSTSSSGARRIETVQVRPLVEELLDISGRDWSKDKIATQIEIEPGTAVRADVGHLQQVLLNLLINARQALRAKGGRLTISASIENERVTITVADNGPGITAEHLPHIFDPFFSTKQTSTEVGQSNSAGLGLHISRNLVHQMQGTLEAASTAGQGATFRITLPQADAELPNSI